MPLSCRAFEHAHQRSQSSRSARSGEQLSVLANPVMNALYCDMIDLHNQTQSVNADMIVIDSLAVCLCCGESDNLGDWYGGGGCCVCDKPSHHSPLRHVTVASGPILTTEDRLDLLRLLVEVAHDDRVPNILQFRFLHDLTRFLSGMRWLPLNGTAVNDKDLECEVRISIGELTHSILQVDSACDGRMSQYVKMRPPRTQHLFGPTHRPGLWTPFPACAIRGGCHFVPDLMTYMESMPAMMGRVEDSEQRRVTATMSLGIHGKTLTEVTDTICQVLETASSFIKVVDRYTGRYVQRQPTLCTVCGTVFDSSNSGTQHYTECKQLHPRTLLFPGAIGYDPNQFDIPLYDMHNLSRDGYELDPRLVAVLSWCVTGYPSSQQWQNAVVLHRESMLHTISHGVISPSAIRQHERLTYAYSPPDCVPEPSLAHSDYQRRTCHGCGTTFANRDFWVAHYMRAKTAWLYNGSCVGCVSSVRETPKFELTAGIQLQSAATRQQRIELLHRVIQCVMSPQSVSTNKEAVLSVAREVIAELKPHVHSLLFVRESSDSDCMRQSQVHSDISGKCWHIEVEQFLDAHLDQSLTLRSQEAKRIRLVREAVTKGTHYPGFREEEAIPLPPLPSPPSTQLTGRSVTYASGASTRATAAAVPNSPTQLDGPQSRGATVGDVDSYLSPATDGPPTTPQQQHSDSLHSTPPPSTRRTKWHQSPELRPKLQRWATSAMAAIRGAMRVVGYLASPGVDARSTPMSPSQPLATACANILRDQGSWLTQLEQQIGTPIADNVALQADIEYFKSIQQVWSVTRSRRGTDTAPTTASQPTASPSFNVSALTPAASPQFDSPHSVIPAAEAVDEQTHGDDGLDYDYSGYTYDGDHEEHVQQVGEADTLLVPDSGKLEPPDSADKSSTQRRIDAIMSESELARAEPVREPRIAPPTTPPLRQSAPVPVNRLSLTPPLQPADRPRIPALPHRPNSVFGPRDKEGTTRAVDESLLHSALTGENTSLSKLITTMQVLRTANTSELDTRSSSTGKPTSTATRQRDAVSEDGLKIGVESKLPVGLDHEQCECGMIGTRQSVMNHWRKKTGCPLLSKGEADRKQKRYSLPLLEVHKESGISLAQMIDNAMTMDAADPVTQGTQWQRVRAWARLAHVTDESQDTRLLDTMPGRHAAKRSSQQSSQSQSQPSAAKPSQESVSSPSSSSAHALATGAPKPGSLRQRVKSSRTAASVTSKQRKRSPEPDSSSSQSSEGDSADDSDSHSDDDSDGESDGSGDSGSDSDTLDPTFGPPSVYEASNSDSRSESDDCAPVTKSRAKPIAAASGVSRRPPTQPQRQQSKARPVGKHASALDAVVRAGRSKPSSGSVASAGSAGSSGSRRTRSSWVLDTDQSVWQWFWAPSVQRALDRNTREVQVLLKSVIHSHLGWQLLQVDFSERGIRPGDVSDLPHSDIYIRVLVDPTLAGETDVKYDKEARDLQSRFGFAQTTRASYDNAARVAERHLSGLAERMAINAAAGMSKDE